MTALVWETPTNAHEKYVRQEKDKAQDVGYQMM
jgi:hypothetical protein